MDDLGDHLIRQLGNGFSQVYFDNAIGKHVVAIGSRGSRARAIAAMAELGLETDVVQRTKDHQQLSDSLEALNRQLLEQIERGEAAVGLTQEGIQVQIAASASAGERSAIRATAEQIAPDAAVKQTTKPTLAADAAATCDGSGAQRYCNQLVGGIRYWTQNVGCTPGFYSGPIGVYDPKMVTAGHCITPGGVQWYSCKAAATPCLYTGSESGQRYGGSSGDNGQLNFTFAANWTIEPGAFDWAAGVRRPMTHTSGPVIGYQLCNYGATTGFSCGTIDQTSYAVTYSPTPLYGATYINGLIRVANICVQGGDSGGPAVMGGGSWAAGVNSGTVPNGSSCSTGFGLVEPINRVQSTYGIFVYGG